MEKPTESIYLATNSQTEKPTTLTPGIRLTPVQGHGTWTDMAPKKGTQAKTAVKSSPKSGKESKKEASKFSLKSLLKTGKKEKGATTAKKAEKAPKGKPAKAAVSKK